MGGVCPDSGIGSLSWSLWSFTILRKPAVFVLEQVRCMLNVDGAMNNNNSIFVVDQSSCPILCMMSPAG